MNDTIDDSNDIWRDALVDGTGKKYDSPPAISEEVCPTGYIRWKTSPTGWIEGYVRFTTAKAFDGRLISTLEVSPDTQNYTPVAQFIIFNPEEKLK